MEQFDELDVNLNFLGFINIESGIVSLATQYFEFCEECSGASFDSIQFDCPECGRNSQNYVFMGAGDGDGIYVVFSLEQAGKHVGLCAIFDSDYELANTYRQEIESGVIPQFDRNHISSYLTTHYYSLGELCNTHTLVIGDQYCSGPDNNLYVSRAVKNEEMADYAVFGYFERADEYSGKHQLGERKIPTMRVLVALDKNIMANVQETASVAFPSWNTFLITQISQVVKSHLEPMADSVRQLNNLLETLASIRTASAATISKDAPVEIFDRFCSNCGQQFSNHESRFCGSCGSPRRFTTKYLN